MKKILLILTVLSLSNLIYCDIEDELSCSPQFGTTKIPPYRIYKDFQEKLYDLQQKIDQTEMDFETLHNADKKRNLINALEKNRIQIAQDIKESINAEEFNIALTKQLTELRKQIINLRNK